MEVVEEPADWSSDITCTSCQAVLHIVESDLQVERFVDNSKGEYWFMGHKGHERVFVECPTQGCERILFVDCPEYIKNRARGKE